MSQQRRPSTQVPVEESPLLSPSAPTYVRREYSVPLRARSADVSVNLPPPDEFALDDSRETAIFVTAVLLKRILTPWFQNTYRTHAQRYSTILRQINSTYCVVAVTIWFMIFTFLIALATLVILIFHVCRIFE